jgi:hypothetical protein
MRHVSVKQERGKEIFRLLQLGGGVHRETSFQKWLAIREWLRLRPGMESEYIGQGLELEGEIIGFVGTHRDRIKIRENVTEVLVMTDTVVHPRHRGPRGLALARHMIEQQVKQPVCGMHFTKKLGKIWKILGAQEMKESNGTFVAVISWPALLEERISILRFFHPLLVWLNMGILQPVINIVTGMKRVRPFVMENLRIIKHASLAACSEQIVSNLCKRFVNAYNIGIYRDYDYLDWRYQRHPFGYYHWFMVWRASEPIGLVVFQQGKKNKIYVKEMIFDPYVGGVVEIMVAGMLEAAQMIRASFLVSKSILPSFILQFTDAGFHIKTKEYNQYLLAMQDIVEGPLLFTYGDFTND